MTSRRKLSLTPSTSTSLKTKMTTYASGMAAVLALAVVAVLMMPGELTGRLPGYKWRKSLTIDSTQVAQGAVLTDFVLYVELDDEALKHTKYGGKVESSTGDDLRFTGADGALMLAQQIESYDEKKGHLVAWVRLDTLRQAQPPTLFLYFGNPQPENTIYYESYSEIALEIKEEKPGSDKARWLTIQHNRTAPQAFYQVGEVEDVAAPLPVEIDHFRAGLKGGSLVLLEWATKVENKNKTFIIERSLDGRQYEAIGKTGGADTSNELLRYTYADHQPPKGLAYYRLTQIGKASTYSYTAITSLAYTLNAAGVKLSSAAPNPFQNEFEITFSSGQPCEVRISLYDENGNTLHEEALQARAGENRYRYPAAASLPRGTYVFTLIGPEKKLQTQILTKLP